MNARRKEDTRENLLDTAIELIWQSSYGNVGVSEICEKAGVTKGGFYHYFDSKAALFQAASDYYWEKMKVTLDAIFSPEHDALTQLEKWLDYIIEKQTQNCPEGNSISGCPFFTSGAQCNSEEVLVRDKVAEMGEKSIRYNTALIRSLASEGRLQSECDAAQIGRMLSYFIQGLFIHGRICCDINIIFNDLREGVYRLINLKTEYRKPKTVPEGASKSSFAVAK